MSLMVRLGMRSAEEGRQAREANVAEIKRKIQESDQTVQLFDGREVNCVDADSVSGYRWIGSGLVFYAGKVIERIDWNEDNYYDECPACSEGVQAKTVEIRWYGEWRPAMGYCCEECDWEDVRLTKLPHSAWWDLCPSAFP